MISQAMDMPVLTPRERAWKAIREVQTEFSIEKIAALAEMKIDATRDYLTGLCKAGFIKVSRRESKPLSVGGNTKVVYYTLIKDIGHQAPSVNRKGDILEPRSVNTAIWNALRMCGAQTPRVLASNASTEKRAVSEETANSYLQALHSAGYVIVISNASHLKQATYILNPEKNTGPKPPQISRAYRVYDPNIGKVVYQEQPEMAEELRDGLQTGGTSHA